MKLTIGVSESAAGNITTELKNKAFIIGQEIARTGAILVTGATTGLSFEAAKGAKSKSGFVVCVSPAENRNEHVGKYKKLTTPFNLIIHEFRTSVKKP